MHTTQCHVPTAFGQHLGSPHYFTAHIRYRRNAPRKGRWDSPVVTSSSTQVTTGSWRQQLRNIFCKTKSISVTAWCMAAAGKGALEPYRKWLQRGRVLPAAVPLWAEPERLTLPQPQDRAAGARVATPAVWAESGWVLVCFYKNKLALNKHSFWTKCGSHQSRHLHCIAMHSAELLQSLMQYLSRPFYLYIYT